MLSNNLSFNYNFEKTVYACSACLNLWLFRIKYYLLLLLYLLYVLCMIFMQNFCKYFFHTRIKNSIFHFQDNCMPLMELKQSM